MKTKKNFTKNILHEKPKNQNDLGKVLAQQYNFLKDKLNFPKEKNYEIKKPFLLNGVVPKDKEAPVLAMDYNPVYSLVNQDCGVPLFNGFPGFPYLSNLALRAEYRQFAEVNSIELTREWITLNSNGIEDKTVNDRISIIEEKINELDLRNVIRKAAWQVDIFGRAQIFIDIENARTELPLALSPKTIKKGSLIKVVPIEPIWSTPAMYNSIDPAAPDFYRPFLWFVMGREIHASRLLTIITREVPDLFKPVFNFAGISLSQLAEPYVENWLKIRQAISDLVTNFSVLSLYTDMSGVLNGIEGAGTNLFNRAQFFNATRNNNGLFLMSKDEEKLEQVAVPLAGLSELQSQAQEHLCTVSGIPAVKLLGVSPAGFNATADGEIRAFYDKKAAEQETYWRHPIDIIIKIIMLSEFGEIDKRISFTFNSLWQLDAKEEQDIRYIKAQTDNIYINDGVFSNLEIREMLAHNALSGYNVSDLSTNSTEELENNDDNDDDVENETDNQEQEESDQN